MLVNEISRQQSNLNISSKGNLIKLANLKFADKTILNKFLNTPCKVLKDNKTNAQIIKKLPFDVYLTKENEGMTLYACYKTGFTEPKSYYLTSIKEKYLNIAKGGIPTDVKEMKVSEDSANICDLLVAAGFATSRGEAKRMVTGNGVKINGETVTDITTMVEAAGEPVIQFGKNKFKKVVKG